MRIAPTDALPMNCLGANALLLKNVTRTIEPQKHHAREVSVVERQNGRLCGSPVP